MEKESEGESNRKEDRRGRERERERSRAWGNPPGSNLRREQRAKWLFTSILSPISEPRCRDRFHAIASLLASSGISLAHELRNGGAGMNKCVGSYVWNRRNLRIDSCEYCYIFVLFCKFFVNETNFMRVDL